MTSKYTVERTHEAGRIVKDFDKNTRRNYDAVVNSLRGEGCVAGGKRLMRDGGGDTNFCQRSFGDKWRMIIAFQGTKITIIEIGEHDQENTPASNLSDLQGNSSIEERQKQFCVTSGRA